MIPGVPRIDIMGIIRAADQLTGASQTASDVAWTAQHPFQRLMGQGRASEQSMQVPIGRWGAGFRGGVQRTGPSVGKAERFRAQDLAYQARLARREAAPLNAIPTQALNAVQMLTQEAMRKAALGRSPVLLKKGASIAKTDQVSRFVEDLNALHIPPYAQAALDRIDPELYARYRAAFSDPIYEAQASGQLTSRTPGAAENLAATREALEAMLESFAETRSNPLQAMLLKSARRTMTHTPARRFAARMEPKGQIAQDLKATRIQDRQGRGKFGRE